MSPRRTYLQLSVIIIVCILTASALKCCTNAECTKSIECPLEASKSCRNGTVYDCTALAGGCNFGICYCQKNLCNAKPEELVSDEESAASKLIVINVLLLFGHFLFL
uniref:EB domain-containing protein n=1 Tax=Panagrellus redivivus TaxID=6233 RepID=A0A7E4V1I9_PANRE